MLSVCVCKDGFISTANNNSKSQGIEMKEAMKVVTTRSVSECDKKRERERERKRDDEEDKAVKEWHTYTI
jgi:hypothetical protein